ncbi:MAG: phage portal protein [Oscillospiraceae bacterium]|nr:phage portal protein [Oscillospiraceae bacterium]
MSLKSLLFSRQKLSDSSALSLFYTTEIAKWNDIYRGGGDWRYVRKGGMNGGMRKLASLGAAKSVCAELSRLCFTEETEITCPDKETEVYLKKVFSDNSFSERFSDFLEKMFALGGGVVKVYYENGVKLDFVSADAFVPTQWDSRSISGGAFGSAVSRNGKNYILAETQEITPKGLLTQNKLFRESGGEVALSECFPEMTEKSLIEGLEKPLFVYFRAGSGIIPQCAPLGSSVFAGAEDTLKSIDTVFDSLSREFVLGKKRIIVPSYAVRGEYNENGELKRYFDVNDEVFEALSASDNDELKISDNTAELRVNEHVEALGELLDLLCMQTGLSEGALSYKNGTIRTATEVVSRNSRTYRTTSFYRKLIAKNLERVVENICILAKMSGELSETASENVQIRFADGVCEDEGTRAERAASLYKNGLISRSRALSEIYGISLDAARAMEMEDFNGN